jgi:hypothetical protein
VRKGSTGTGFVLQVLFGLAIATAVVGFTYRRSSLSLPLVITFLVLAGGFVALSLVTGVSLRRPNAVTSRTDGGRFRPASRKKRALIISVVGFFALLLIVSDALSAGGLKVSDVILAGGVLVLIIVVSLFGGRNDR